MNNGSHCDGRTQPIPFQLSSTTPNSQAAELPAKLYLLLARAITATTAITAITAITITAITSYYLLLLLLLYHLILTITSYQLVCEMHISRFHRTLTGKFIRSKHLCISVTILGLVYYCFITKYYSQLHAGWLPKRHYEFVFENVTLLHNICQMNFLRFFNFLLNSW